MHIATYKIPIDYKTEVVIPVFHNILSVGVYENNLIMACLVDDESNVTKIKGRILPTRYPITDELQMTYMGSFLINKQIKHLFLDLDGTK